MNTVNTSLAMDTVPPSSSHAGQSRTPDAVALRSTAPESFFRGGGSKTNVPGEDGHYDIGGAAVDRHDAQIGICARLAARTFRLSRRTARDRSDHRSSG